MEAELQKLQDRLAKAKEVFRDMDAKMKEKDAKLVETEAQLRTMEERWQNADEFAIKYGSEVKMLNETIETMRFDLMKATGERDRIQMDYDKLNETATPVLAMNTELTTTNANLKQEIVDLRNAADYTIAEKNRLIMELENVKVKAREALDKSKANITALQEKYDNETARLQQIINDNLAANKDLTMRNDELDGLATARLTDINKLTEDIVKLNEVIETLKSDSEELVNARATITSLNNKISELKQQNDSTKSQVEAKVSEVKKRLQALNDGLGDEFNIFG